jgi:hypothetical protein
MKYLSLIALFVLISCGNKEDILLPKSDTTIVSTIEDHSPIYIFFRTKEKDTLAEVNRKNSIISTNWILNIDKRLPLGIVIPEVMLLQDKKREEKAHKNEKAENYYSYADSIGKNMAFIPFTKVFYKMSKPSGTIVFFNKKNEILVNNALVKQGELETYVKELVDKSNPYQLCFDKEMSFDTYINSIIYLHSVNLQTNEQFVF